MKTPMLANSKPSRWLGIDIFGQMWGEISKRLIKSCPVCQQVKINKHEQVKPGSFQSEEHYLNWSTSTMLGHYQNLLATNTSLQ